MAAASLLDLPDELYGLIYERIDSADSRRAFRHSHSSLHRSRAINDHLTSLSITSTTHFVPCLAAFPRSATLRRLNVEVNLKFENLEACLAQTTLPASAESVAARQHLRSVHHLTIQGCAINEKCVSPLIDCFPKLREGGEGACLELVDCYMRTMDSPLGRCLAAFKLQRLVIVRSDNCGMVFSQLTSATSVKHLLIDCEEWNEYNVKELSALTQLVSLELYSMKPRGFNGLLAALPHLRFLGIEVDMYRHYDEPWSSKTVEHISVPMVTAHTRAISAADHFPALKFFEFGGIEIVSDYDDLADWDSHDLYYLELVKGMASWLSALPLKAGQRLTQLPDKKAFCLSGLWTEDVDNDCAACIRALSSLPPIKRALSEVKVLFAEGYECSPESLSALAELFCGVQELTLTGNISRTPSLSHLLLLCMRGMPHLWYLHVDLSGMRGVHEIIVPLIEARDTRSRFELRVTEEAGSEGYNMLEVVAAQWAKVRSLLPSGPPVSMTVMPV